MTIQQFIYKYNAELVTINGERRLRTDSNVMKNPEDVSFVKTHKSEIISFLDAQESERKETAKHTITFDVFGWEYHSVSIDDRKDLRSQFNQIAELYSDDGITVEMVIAAYNKNTGAAESATEIISANFDSSDDFRVPMSDAECKKWVKNYVYTINENADGFVPTKSDLENITNRRTLQ